MCVCVRAVCDNATLKVQKNISIVTARFLSFISMRAYMQRSHCHLHGPNVQPNTLRPLTMLNVYKQKTTEFRKNNNRKTKIIFRSACFHYRSHLCSFSLLFSRALADLFLENPIFFCSPVFHVRLSFQTAFWFFDFCFFFFQICCEKKHNFLFRNDVTTIDHVLF